LPIDQKRVLIRTCSAISSQRTFTRKTTNITLQTIIPIIVLSICTSPVRVVLRHQSMFNWSFSFRQILNTDSIIVDVHCSVSCRTVFNAFSIVSSECCDVTCFTVSCAIDTMMTYLVADLAFSSCHSRVIVNVPVPNFTSTESSCCHSLRMSN